MTTIPGKHWSGRGIWEAYQTLAEADFARDGGTEAEGVPVEGRSWRRPRIPPLQELVAPDNRELAALFRNAGA